MEVVKRRDAAESRDAHAGRAGGLSDELFAYYHALLCRLGWPGGSGAGLLRTLGVTSSRSGEGTSTVAAGLAVAAANSSERQVLLVDANLRRPSLHRGFAVDAVPGLCEYLLGEDQTRTSIHATGVARLSVLPAGRALGPRWQDCIAADWSDCLAKLRSAYDLLLFDLPVADDPFTLRLAGVLDGLLLVIEAEQVPHDVVQHSVQSLTQARGQVLGAVLNKHRP
jgi:capsular exopolysaccharide synthesis family protein